MFHDNKYHKQQCFLDWEDKATQPEHHIHPYLNSRDPHWGELLATTTLIAELFSTHMPIRLDDVDQVTKVAPYLRMKVMCRLISMHTPKTVVYTKQRNLPGSRK